jgi:replicative DNA helicase
MAYSFSDKIQKGILFLLKYNQDFFSEIVALIKPEFFDYPSYSLIFEKIKSYQSEYGRLPPDDILIEFIKQDLPKNESISDYQQDIEDINNIDKSVIENRDYILDLVEGFARKQAVKAAIKNSIRHLEDDNTAAIEEEVRKALLVSRVHNIGQQYFDDIEARYQRAFVEKNKNRFKTVFNSCNNYLEGGVCPKELCMVIAPPGVGKSLYLVNQSVVALTENRKVLYISLEMSEDKIAQRIDSVITLIPNSKLKEPSYRDIFKQRLSIFTTKFKDAKLVIKEFPTGQLTVNDIRALLVQLKLYYNFKPDVIMVDYLELLRPNRVIDAEYQAQERIAQELRGLAVEHNCLIWTATQTNRNGKKVNLITDAELGDSYGKIRPVDWAISLNQTSEEYDKGYMRAWVVKARDSKQHYLIPVAVNYSNLLMEETTQPPEMAENESQ